MFRVTRWAVAVAAFQTALFAQTFTGAWQGALQVPNRELRVVFKISTTDADKLKAVLYSIDQGGQPIPASAVTTQGSSIKISVAGIGGTFEGKMNADGNSISGTWSQGGPMPLTLSLKRATPETAWAIPEPPPPPKPMAANANPVFEVATIKPSDPSKPGKLFRVQPGHFSTLNTTLTDIIGFAYGYHPKQLIGASSWVDTDKWDLDGKPDGEGQPSLDQWKNMLQKLLADRFQLSFHHDKKELSVYLLVVAKGGPKMTKSESNGTVPALLFQGLGRLPVRNATMADFAGVMQGAVLDRPVVDQTNIEGRWDFVLNWTPDETQFAALGGVPANLPQNADAPPNLFDAIQQQVGLKFEPARSPVDVVVIDKVAKPSAN